MKVTGHRSVDAWRQGLDGWWSRQGCGEVSREDSTSAVNRYNRARRAKLVEPSD